MSRLLSMLCGSFFAVAITGANAAPSTFSPNRAFEAYTTAHYPDGTGARLFLRAARSAKSGILLRENDRWIEAQWSPDSRFLAVTDGSDGHVTDVFVYRVRSSRGKKTQASYTTFQTLGEIAVWAHAPRAAAELCYHTPDPGTYDVQWAVARWAARGSTILLTKRTPGAKPTRKRVSLTRPSSSRPR